ncbi:MAG: glycine cleavage system aminomethyltransferase GcvT [Flavobacteriales bacterium]|jgi:aminomethyltransferase|nr:glycine cleavage system aminomethyltransferase GcvT [Flavobacteriales bacterium]MBT6175141.1 glycine cleavage system aminomethyltransferase GcvT [Flavobacteriales bacterium]
MMEKPNLIKTALHEKHLELGAKMVDYSGFEMPVSYDGLKVEHASVREKVGMFDVSHMGEFTLIGEDALEVLQKITTNDVSNLNDGKIQYSCIPNGKGGIVDDLLIYRISEGNYMLVVNASNMDKDWGFISHKIKDGGYNVTFENNSDDLALIALQGPNATDALSPLMNVNPGDLAYYTFISAEILGVECIVSATGYTGAGGYELYIPVEHSGMVWSKLLENGVTPCGLGARDTLRMEMGFCLYGNDIDETTNAIEAGLGWITKFSKDFTDKDLLEKVKAEGPSRRLKGLKMLGRGIPRKGYEVVTQSGEVVGEVTSGTMSPTLGYGIGMAYINSEFSKKGNKLSVRIRNKNIEAEVVMFPFLNQG